MPSSHYKTHDAVSRSLSPSFSFYFEAAPHNINPVAEEVGERG